MSAPLRVAVAGLGRIGGTVAAELGAGRIPGQVLTAVAARDAAKAHEFIRGFAQPVAITDLRTLGEHADVVVECAPHELLAQIAEPVLGAGKSLIVLSVGALLDNEHLPRIARESGAKIFVPTGSLVGLDAVIGAAEGTIRSVSMVSRKPPASLLGAPYLRERGIDLSELREPMRIFAGTAREAARGFTASLNIAVSLALAGIGPERTRLEVWADPGTTNNTHHIEVESDSAILRMSIENLPTADPRTVRITARSVIALLRKMTATIRIGT